METWEYFEAGDHSGLAVNIGALNSGRVKSE